MISPYKSPVKAAKNQPKNGMCKSKGHRKTDSINIPGADKTPNIKDPSSAVISCSGVTGGSPASGRPKPALSIIPKDKRVKVRYTIEQAIKKIICFRVIFFIY